MMNAYSIFFNPLPPKPFHSKEPPNKIEFSVAPVQSVLKFFLKPVKAKEITVKILNAILDTVHLMSFV